MKRKIKEYHPAFPKQEGLLLLQIYIKMRNQRHRQREPIMGGLELHKSTGLKSLSLFPH